jgi:hypothetical protein
VDQNLFQSRVFIGVQFEQPLGFPLKTCGNDGPGIQASETKRWQKKNGRKKRKDC